MVRVIGIEIVGQYGAIGRINRVQVAGTPHAFRSVRSQHHAEIVNEDGLSTFR